MADDLHTDSPDLGTMIGQAIDSRLVDVHTSMPGRVESYDKDRQVADVRPQLRRVLRRRNGDRVSEELPVIPCVPVTQLRVGDFFIHLPVAEGTFGTLFFNEADIGRWRSIGDVVDPGDTRRHDLSAASFLPGLFPQSGALPSGDTDAARMTLGASGGAQIDIDAAGIRLGKAAATEGIALGDAIKTFLDSLKTWLDAHIHVTTATVSGGPVGVLSAPTPSSPTPPTTASTKHKVEP